MNRITVATRGICNWQDRLASPATQWRRQFSAFEAAVSWEMADRTESGLPGPILALLQIAYGSPQLLLAVAEHKVRLPGGNADSQNDVWCLVKTAAGTVSVSIEAKARESFGNETLGAWIQAGESERSRLNRKTRWAHIRSHLPNVVGDAYSPVAYQLLHRCASAVIEARRFELKHAACIVQAFCTPDDRFDEFAVFCRAMGISASRGGIQKTVVGDTVVAIGWADSQLATDEIIAELS